MTAGSNGPFNPAKRKRHSGALVVDDGPEAWPLLVGPKEPWHYALEYPLMRDQVKPGPAALYAELTVLQGEIGIACMGPNNTILTQTVRREDEGRTSVTLVVEDLSQCRSLMFRSGGLAGHSIAQIHGLGFVPAAVTEPLQEPVSPVPRVAPGTEPLNRFDLDRLVLHNDASLLEDESASQRPLLITPLAPAKDAFELTVDPPFLAREPIAIYIDLSVMRGMLSISALTRDGRVLSEVFASEYQGRITVELVVGDFSECVSLMIRNADDSKRSLFELHDVTASRDLQGQVAEPLRVDSYRGQPFAPGMRLRHNKTFVITDDPVKWPLVVSPSEEWTYALEFSVTRVSPPGPALVSVDLTLLRGEIGIGCTDNKGNVMCEAFRSVEDRRSTVSLFIDDFSKCQALLFRTGVNPGRSVVQIHDVEVTYDVEAPAIPILQINSEVFSRYPTWSGSIPPGFTGDWLGVITRAGVEWSSATPEMQEALLVERVGSYPPPTDTDLLLDWEPLLTAIEVAGPKCTAVALGAGWGRWIVGFASAAQRRGRDYHIVGVEAEPQHFEWMARHLKDNNIPPEKSRLIQAAANSYTGTCYFMVGNAQGWYGQAVVSDAQFKSAAFQAVLHESGAGAEATPCVDLNEIFAGLDRVDYLHMDIQGSEADVLLAYPDLLDEKVATVNIGTHSELIERRLRRHFTERGWLCRYDVPMNATILASVDGKEPSEITFGDGVFVWENPRLTSNADVPSFRVPTLIRG